MIAKKTEITSEEGHPLWVVQLVNDPSSGYVCTQEEGGRKTLSWFGPGERFSTEKEAVEFYDAFFEMAKAYRSGSPERLAALAEVIGPEKYNAVYEEYCR